MKKKAILITILLLYVGLAFTVNTECKAQELSIDDSEKIVASDELDEIIEDESSDDEEISISDVDSCVNFETEDECRPEIPADSAQEATGSVEEVMLTSADTISDNKLRIEGISIEDNTYTGKAITFDVRVYYEDVLLREKADYTAKYMYNKNACENLASDTAPCVVLKGRGSLKNDIDKAIKFKIKPIDISDYTATNPAFIYDGKKHKPVINVSKNGKSLKLNRDYEIAYTNSPEGLSEIGSYEVLIKGKGNYTGQQKSEFIIADGNTTALLSKASIKNHQPKCIYNGQVQLQNEAKLYYKNEEIAADKYEVRYVNNIDIGVATVIFSAKKDSGFVGEKRLSFRIVGKPIASTKMTYIKSHTYTGSLICPEITIATRDGSTLAEGTHYKISYSKNIHTGKGIIFITGIGEYSGQARKLFQIRSVDLRDGDMISANIINDSLTENKGKKSAEVSVTFCGKKLIKGRDYVLSYKNASVKAKKPLQVIIKGKGNFTKSIARTYCSPLIADGIFVAPNGNDLSEGDIDHPLKSVQKAIDKASPGETIYLRGGTYTALSGNVFKKSGTDENGLITISGYPNEKAVVTIKQGVSGAAFSLNGNDYIKISNLTISGLKASDVYGVLMEGGEKYVYIENCEFSNIVTTKPGSEDEAGGSSNAILLYGEKNSAAGSISHIYIKNNRVHDNVNGWSENISVAGNCEYVYVENNTVYNNTNIGIDFYGNAEYCKDKSLDQPRHCECKGNKVYKCKSFYAENAGIYIDGAYDILVEGNESYNNDYGIEIGSEEWRSNYDDNNRVRQIVVRNNNIHNNAECGMRLGGWTNDNTTGVVYDCLIEGNTFKQNDEGTEIILSKCDKIRFKNNTFTNGRGYSEVVAYDEDIDREKITNIIFE